MSMMASAECAEVNVPNVLKSMSMMACAECGCTCATHLPPDFKTRTHSMSMHLT